MDSGFDSVFLQINLIGCQSMKLNQAFEDKPERMDDAVQTFVDFSSLFLYELVSGNFLGKT